MNLRRYIPAGCVGHRIILDRRGWGQALGLTQRVVLAMGSDWLEASQVFWEEINTARRTTLKGERR
jgi:hypothetical protein